MSGVWIREIYIWVRRLVENPTITVNTTTANWNSGVATSGLAGGDLVTLGTALSWWTLTEIYLLLSAFNAGATVTVRAYMTLLGAERLVMEEDYVVAAEPDVIYIFWWWELRIYGQVRIEVHSDQAADDGLAATYEHRIKEW